MIRRVRALSRLQILWVAGIVAPATWQLGLARLWPSSSIRESPAALFWIVVIGASLCAVTSLLVLSRSLRTGEVELAYLGSFFLAVSLLPLVHGITTPGVLYGDNEATVTSAFWSIPLAALVGLPALVRRGTLADRFDAVWRKWVFFSSALVISLATSLLIWTWLLPAPEVGSAWTNSVAVASFGLCVMLSLRHLALAVIARSAAPLVISVGYGFVGSSALVWVGAAVPFSSAFWVAHALDLTGVFLGTVGALVVFSKADSVRGTLTPILLVDPRAALELGLEPAVHEFVRDLEEKDPITRDHVVRTTELAMSTGRKLGVDGEDLRELGLTALLHDIGKLRLPDALLNKPGKLTDGEYEMIKRHADYGADILAESTTLASIAPAVRAHHERIDGDGYPLGLAGSQIPFHARIVAVCDAYDAMSNTRQYRKGMSVARALEVLEEHAGSQWDSRVVDIVVRSVRAKPPTEVPQLLDSIGRIGCDCIPDYVQVDAA